MNKTLFFIIILFSLQSYAQRHTADNGMVDIKLLATDAQTGEIIPYAVFKVEIDGKAIGLVSNQGVKDVYYKICPQKVIIKTLVFTAYGYECDTAQQELYFKIIEDTSLYFALNRKSTKTATTSDYLTFRSTFYTNEVGCSWIKPLTHGAVIYYQHCDGRIAISDSIPEKEMIAGSWSLLEIPDQLIARCPSGDCERHDSVMYVNPSGDTIIPYDGYTYLWYGVILDYGYVDQKQKNGRSKMVAINNKGEYLFDAYIYDYGPDNTEEGRFRIMKNGKIGFANEKGEIVVEPQFECAHYFQDGKARVTYKCTLVPDGEYHSVKNATWFYIDLDGNVVE
ncbi:MAG: hypothetical protein GQ574_05750 [Crocinitomix sp.]|nr:hypothetical protein [Crocinitomix sp.]